MSGDLRVVLFDGECGLCAASVRFILRRDPAARFRFAPLQSATGRRMMAQHHLPPDDLGSLVLIEDGRASVSYTHLTLPTSDLV